MNLNDLLVSKKIDPEQVLVLRHRPSDPRLNKVLPWLAAERPDVFNAYQQTQGAKVERAMTTASYVASFIGHEPAKALFVGLYSIGPSISLDREEYWQLPAHIELKTFGMRGFTEEDGRTAILCFDLVATDFYASWKGKLIVGWPSPERSWWRRAHRNVIPIEAILEESALVDNVPEWKDILFHWEELGVLPSPWRIAISQWRAIYYIYDISDGKGYVGSAYGANNLFGRWLNYAVSGHGDNRLLKMREPNNFRFTILERVAPDMDGSDVIRLEETWKKRLHTRFPSGLNDN